MKEKKDQSDKRSPEVQRSQKVDKQADKQNNATRSQRKTSSGAAKS
jgi:hypothetical protein